MKPMADLKMAKKAKKDSAPSVAAPDTPDYPYGTRLSLNADSLDKLGLKSMPKVGSKFMVHGMGVVTAVSSHESKNGGDRSVEIQLQKMCCEPGEKGDMEDEMRKGYRKMQGQNEEE